MKFSGLNFTQASQIASGIRLRVGDVLFYSTVFHCHVW